VYIVFLVIDAAGGHQRFIPPQDFDPSTGVFTVRFPDGRRARVRNTMDFDSIGIALACSHKMLWRGRACHNTALPTIEWLDGESSARGNAIEVAAPLALRPTQGGAPR
jgi:hypothetical protein|tara:strand:+ start:150 stop:473 length:324 start_codon:yes stop_codon:yes gene_type:complete